MNKKYFKVKVMNRFTVEDIECLGENLKEKVLDNVAIVNDKWFNPMELTYIGDSGYALDDIVIVPYGTREMIGVLVGYDDERNLSKNIKYKEIRGLYEV